MLELDNYIKLDSAAILSANLCERFSSDDLSRIGSLCSMGYDQDERSREDWLRRNEAGMDLALQVTKEKTFPWANCSNVAFPLVTIAAMQFHARAYPAIVDGPNIVKGTVHMPDPQGQLWARANRVASHMSWQLLNQDKAWEEGEDCAIFNLSIVGCNFKKSYYSDSKAHNVSEFVLAKNLVLNYWAKSVEECERKTHIIPLFRNEVYEKIQRGIFRDVLEESWYKGTAAVTLTQAQREENARQGITQPPPDAITSLIFLEQHCSLDLDNDGYAEPYIITFEKTSRRVVRIVTRFDSEKAIERVQVGKGAGKIIRIRANEFFTRKIFIPSPDGGIYGIGFGVFLGPINEATNSIVNMLVDGGTLQTAAGGFLGRGAKIRGGAYRVSPFEWKRVDSTGDDLRKSIVPLPVNAPSDVLFQLLSLLINYGSRVAGTTDITVGENPGQNTPAQTTQTMVEMGQKIYTAIFKRIWRASKEEFTKLYHLNAAFLKPMVVYPGGATLEDYSGDGSDISPVADPNLTSDSQQITRAMTLKAAASTTLGYNKDAVEHLFLQALRVENIPAIYPGTEGQPAPKDIKLQVAEVKAQADMQSTQLELQARAQEFVMKLMEEREVNNAKIAELYAKAAEHGANAQSEQAYAQVAMVNAEISRAKIENDGLDRRIDQFMRVVELQTNTALKRKELELKSAA